MIVTRSDAPNTPVGSLIIGLVGITVFLVMMCLSAREARTMLYSDPFGYQAVAAASAPKCDPHAPHGGMFNPCATLDTSRIDDLRTSRG